MTAAPQPRTSGPARRGQSRFAPPSRTCRRDPSRWTARPANRLAGRKTAPGIFLAPAPKTRQETVSLSLGTHQESSTYVFVFAPGCVVAPNGALGEAGSVGTTGPWPNQDPARPDSAHSGRWLSQSSGSDCLPTSCANLVNLESSIDPAYNPTGTVGDERAAFAALYGWSGISAFFRFAIDGSRITDGVANMLNRQIDPGPAGPGFFFANANLTVQMLIDYHNLSGGPMIIGTNAGGPHAVMVLAAPQNMEGDFIIVDPDPFWQGREISVPAKQLQKYFDPNAGAILPTIGRH